MGTYSMGSGPKVPLVTSHEAAVKGSSVGVYMLGLWRIASWLRTTESDVGSRNFRAVNSIVDSSTPCCAMCGIATYTLQYRSVSA